MCRALATICLVLTMSTSSSIAFEAHEFFISVHDPGIVKEQRIHLPRFIRTRRIRAIGDGPPPAHGGILLEGKMPNVLDAVVKLPPKTPISGSWPQAKVRDGNLSWTALTPGTQKLRPGNNWWDQLRSDNLGVGRDGQYDNILFFDPNLDLAKRYALEVSNGAITVKSIDQSPAPKMILALSRKDDQWASIGATLDKAATPGNTAPLADTITPLTKGAPPRLQKHVVAIIKHALTGANHAILVQLPENTVTSEVLPLPDKHTKIHLGLLIWRDQRSTEDWDNLIKQLGHADWAMRETASDTLAEAGESALPALAKAIKHKDPEIQLRAERLVMRLGKNPDKLEKSDKKDQAKRGR